MAKCCSVCVVTVVLLGCFVGIQVEAQTVDQSNIRGSLHTLIAAQRQRQTVEKPPQTHISTTVRLQGWTQNPQPAVDRCAVPGEVRVICGQAPITVNECEALDCCFDGYQCYYGKAVTLQCTKAGEFIVVVAKDATVPLLDLDTISLLGQGQGCSYVDSNSAFAIYQFPVTACGTVVMDESGTIVYENRMVSAYEVGIGELGAITRDSQFELIFQCKYYGNSAVRALVFDEIREQIHWQVSGTGTVVVEMLVASGSISSSDPNSDPKGSNDMGATFSTFHTEFPVTKALKEPVYVDIGVNGIHPNIHLTLGRCWATYGASPHSLPQWDILIDGCPYEGDKYASKLIRVDHSSGLMYPHHHKYFMFQMFTFVNPQTLSHMSEQMYLHCSVHLCVPAQGITCEPSCPPNSYRNKRDVGAKGQENTVNRVASVGPLIFHSGEQQHL